ncbi:hypothetical protein TREES_T100003187 [Tupaia chinensis]|uniref:Uncharacterized protein n=1 Tax=Tupaia chinensis TaxID=246437 RepID=L9KFA0_TUPCH|nr:hypothetical protein TREES_T100003187 [Tupaia chinensis]
MDETSLRLEEDWKKGLQREVGWQPSRDLPTALSPLSSPLLNWVPIGLESLCSSGIKAVERTDTRLHEKVTRDVALELKVIGKVFYAKIFYDFPDDLILCMSLTSGDKPV